MVSFEQLLGIFFKTHDPTQLNRQGNDVGEQYRSVVFYHDNEQRKAAEKKLRELETNQTHKSKVVTQIEAFKSFYEAEGYHKDYYDKNRNADYCKIVIDPKIQKLYKEFGDKVKEEYGEKPN